MISIPRAALLTGALALTGVVHAQQGKPDPQGLNIETMRETSYPGSAITIERTLGAGANYKRYVASYMSQGLKINALLTVPNGTSPEGGWPAIIFNHGYIPPNVYRTTQRYVAYQDAFARNGFVTFKSDYRGHGSSQGEAVSAYWSPADTADVLNATASVQKYKNVNRERIGMWGHSMGGNITLRAMVVNPDIKAGVIWGGVVAPYSDILNSWTHRPGAEAPPPNARKNRQKILAKFGTPKSNPTFWNAIDPSNYLGDLNGRPIQLDHSTTDEEVPFAFGKTLEKNLKAAGQNVTFYAYPGDNHNISGNLSTALGRSVEFFKKNL